MAKKLLPKMLLVILTVVVFILSGLSYAQSVSSGLINLDFESTELGSLDKGGWVSLPPEGMKTYKAALSKHTPHGGNQCLEISSTGEVLTGAGNIWQFIDATPLRGRYISYKAYVRVESEENAQAQLILRIDGQSSPLPSFLDNMHERPITSSAWMVYTITGFVDHDATKIFIGCIFKGKGKAYVDDVTLSPGIESIEVEPITNYKNEIPKPLSQQGLQNIKAFGKLYGYIRYFHPSDQAARVIWDNIAINEVHNIERAANDEELVMLLRKIFYPLAPTIQISTGHAPKSVKQIEPPAEATHVSLWKHVGVGMGNRAYYSKREKYSIPKISNNSSLSTLYNSKRVTHKQLTDNIWVSVPVFVFSNGKKTLPIIEMEDRIDTLNKDHSPSGNDRSTRLADVIILWNVIEHFYPYFDAITSNWDNVFATILSKAAISESIIDFELVLREMMAHINDGHGFVSGPGGWSGIRYAPIGIYATSDTIVVTDILDEAKQYFKIGDVIEKINGEPIKSYYDRRRKLICAATPQYKDYMLSRSALGIYRKDSVTFGIRSSDGILRSVSVKTVSQLPYFDYDRPGNITELRPGIYYVNLDKVTTEEYDEKVDVLAAAKAIIFDMRGYPSRIYLHPIKNFIEKPVQSPYFNMPVTRYPDREVVEWDTSRWVIEPKGPKFTKNIVHLIDRTAMSAAETYMGIIEYYKLGEIVGSTTAGTNGDINPFTLPGNYNVRWTGLKVLKHDGSQHHGVGIQPTIFCKPTVEGIRDGRDEVLEKGIVVAKMMIEKDR